MTESVNSTNTPIGTLILRYLKMKNTTGASASQILGMFPHRFSKPSRVNERLTDLHSKGYIKKKNSMCWAITPQGTNFLQRYAKKSALQGSD